VCHGFRERALSAMARIVWHARVLHVPVFCLLLPALILPLPLSHRTSVLPAHPCSAPPRRRLETGTTPQQATPVPAPALSATKWCLRPTSPRMTVTCRPWSTSGVRCVYASLSGRSWSLRLLSLRLMCYMACCWLWVLAVDR
jgi:hypothetical protein